ncbi:uncharacterized protein LODBEIA_P39750 [Lodderomyces beijingensis]|uniref:DNA mismatch repair proteins mutS family domain-containing protein n=1 Tax=Lodderomyces beijingensis TaxID=1775926 RepID=A0ABP0ZS38_9ASCO
MSTTFEMRFANSGAERTFIQKLRDKSPQDIRFLDHYNGEYFSCLEQDADLIADEIYKTRSVIKTHNGTRFITISPQVFANVLKYALLDQRMRVEIYDAKRYELLVSGTAGNLDAVSEKYAVNFEFSDFSSSSIAAVKIVANTVGVCFIDDGEDKIWLCQFEDNELLSHLESLLVSVGVKEVLMTSSSQSGDNKKLENVVNKLGNVVVSTSTQFNTKNVESDLSKLVEEENLEMSLSAKGIKMSESGVAFACCNALISYLGLLEKDDLGSFQIDQYDLTSFMKLDSATIKALNVFPEFKSSSINSVFELLNKCKSACGSRLLSQWLKQPLTSVVEIEERQQLVGLLMNDAGLRVSVQDILGQVPDIKRLLKKMNIGMAKNGHDNRKLEDLVRLYQLVLLLPGLIQLLQKNGDRRESVNELVEKYWREPISKSYSSLRKFQELVETTVDLKGLHDLHSNFDIRPEFDASLIEINDKKNDAMDQIKNLHLAAADDLNMEADKKLKLEQHQVHGFCMRLTRTDSVVLRNNTRTYIELQTVKAGVYFTTAELRKQAQAYAQACDEYNHKQRELIREVISISLTYSSVLTKLSLDLAHLDVIMSFATVALVAPTTFVQPKMIPLDSKERKMQVKNSRHPLLEVQDDVDFVPNDVDIEEQFFNIITGPNMGGKSTYLKQIATLALMAQVGSFIPADDNDGTSDGVATLPVFDAILSRVGAGDSQLKGLSTFMIEMLETSSILASATSNSLIIIDELGRGTSTYDGFGLAWSISEHLIQQKQCICIFATHFHELNQLANIYPQQVKNLHVVAYVENKDDITLMYKIEPGISSRSFGINVAEMVKFPEKIIRMAKRKAEELENDKSKRVEDVDMDANELKLEVEQLKSVLKEWRNKNQYDVEEASRELHKLLDENSNGYIKELIASL